MLILCKLTDLAVSEGAVHGLMAEVHKVVVHVRSFYAHLLLDIQVQVGFYRVIQLVELALTGNSMNFFMVILSYGFMLTLTLIVVPRLGLHDSLLPQINAAIALHHILLALEIVDRRKATERHF